MSNTLAIAIELGVPAIVTVLLFFAPKLRPFCYSVLGALTPFLFAYLSTYLAAQNGERVEASVAFDAIWTMTILPYSLALLAGIALGLYSRPSHSAMRFSAAAVVSICVATVFIAMA